MWYVPFQPAQQFVIEEEIVYDRPFGLEGLGRARVRRRRPIVRQGRVFAAQPGAAAPRGQAVQEAQGGQEAQEIAAQELAAQQPRAKRFLVEPEGIARMRAEGAQIFGGGIGQEAVEERRQIQEAAKRERWNRSPAGQEFFRQEAQAGEARRKASLSGRIEQAGFGIRRQYPWLAQSGLGAIETGITTSSQADCLARKAVWTRIGTCKSVNTTPQDPRTMVLLGPAVTVCDRRWYLGLGECKPVTDTPGQCAQAGGVWGPWTKDKYGCTVPGRPGAPLPQDPNWPTTQAACEAKAGYWNKYPDCKPGAPCPAIVVRYSCLLPASQVSASGFATLSAPPILFTRPLPQITQPPAARDPKHIGPLPSSSLVVGAVGPSAPPLGLNMSRLSTRPLVTIPVAVGLAVLLGLVLMRKH